MFRSRSRAIIIPQSEHLKLAGTLALLWGNADFDLPPTDRSSLVLGVGQHDRGYGYLDNSPVGEMPEDEWFGIARKGFSMPCSDVVGDLIVKYHFIRLANYSQTIKRQALTREFKQEAQQVLEAHGLSPELFARIDRITDLLDSISVAFCKDQPVDGQVPVHAINGRDELVNVNYKVEAGEIRANPWPFSVDSYSGYILGYKRDGYPAITDPVILPFKLVK
ncbi:MAG TPA: DUF3891 family protein [Anaerolineales bacterium]|jgi:hypothetical protein